MRRVALVLVVCLLPLAGCDLINKITNDRVMVGMVLVSPQHVDTTPPTVTIPGEGVAQVFLGDRASDGSSVTGVAGAQVTISWGTSSSLPLTDQGGGNYTAAFDPTNYSEGATYTFTATAGGKNYWVNVVAPPVTDVLEFQSSQVLLAPPPPTTLTRTSPSGTLGFFAVANTSDMQQTTCDNFPKSGSDFVNLLLNPSKWQAAQFTLDPTCFPVQSIGTFYVAELTSVKQGSGSSDNLSLGSGAFAGIAGGGLVVFH